MKAMGQDHIVKAMGQGHVVKAMGLDHVVKAMGQDHVVKAMGHDNVDEVLYLHVHVGTCSCCMVHNMPVHTTHYSSTCKTPVQDGRSNEMLYFEGYIYLINGGVYPMWYT